MSTYGGQRSDGKGLANNPPIPPWPQRGESLAKVFLRVGVSTYGGHGLNGSQAMENPPPPTQREEYLEKIRFLDGVRTY